MMSDWISAAAVRGGGEGMRDGKLRAAEATLAVSH
jgi:hypothetical protein